MKKSDDKEWARSGRKKSIGVLKARIDKGLHGYLGNYDNRVSSVY